MKLTKTIAAIAMLSLTAAPAIAAPAASPAAKLSVAKSVRASSPGNGASRLADGPSTITALFFGALVVGGVVALATSDGDDDKADSN